MKVAYFCTSFPVLSETFLQREVQALSSRTDLSIKLYSLWGGSNTWNGVQIQRIQKWKLLSLLWLIPYEAIRSPKGFIKTAKTLFSKKPTSWLNFWENMLGTGIGFFLARSHRKEQIDKLHATWASMPAATALTLHHLLGTPFSFGAHAYDIFENDGDWLLGEKLKAAAFVHTSTQNAARVLELKTHAGDKIKLIRRGLAAFPPFQKSLRSTGCLHLLTVGRLVEKKGYHHQLKIYRSLKEKGVPFSARILGEGPLRQKLQSTIDEYGLKEHVTLHGAVSQQDVFKHYTWADFFIFTGIIASNGDRDGLPNVIPEAMACGVTVLTSNVAGTLEAIHDGKTGMCCPVEDAEYWAKTLQELHNNAELNESLRTQARDWVLEHFDAHKNAEKLVTHLKQSAKQGSTFAKK